MSRVGTGLKFDPEWRITLLTVVMVPLLLGLGVWQLQRAQEKAALAAAFEERQQQPPVPLATLWGRDAGALAYQRVRMLGSFVPDKYFLLDNQVQHGAAGYEVLGILQLADASGSVLVNRGWIAGDATRRTLPVVPVVAGPVEITGQVYVAPGTPFLLAEQDLDAAAWPQLIQAVEMDKLLPVVAALQGNSVFPFPIRIDADAAGALTVNWQVVNMGPEKHQGYAVQWFALAAVLSVFYLLRSSNLWQLLTGAGRTGK